MCISYNYIEDLPSSSSNRFSHREEFEKIRWAAVAGNAEARTSISFAAASCPDTLMSSELINLFWSPQPAATAEEAA
jgi:hypothetical protein